MRIFQTGAEMQVVDELNDISAGGFINPSTTHSLESAASYRMQYNESGFVQNFGYVPISGSQTNVYYKADVYVDALTPTTNTSTARTFFYPIRFYSSNYVASVGLYNSAGTLHCFVQYGTSSTLTHDVTLTGVGLDEWLRVEAHFDSTPADGSEIFEVKINGETIISDTNLTLSGKTMAYAFYHITNNTSGTTTADVYMDNISINNASGDVNNSWVGEEYIVCALPSAAGDSNPTSGTYASINEMPATKTATNSTNYIAIDNTSDHAWFKVATPDINNVEHEINAVSVPAFVREDSAGTSWYNVGIKSMSSGREYYANGLYYPDLSYMMIGGFDAGNQIVRYSPSGTTAGVVIPISNTDPTTNAKWKVTGTNSLANAQIGARKTDSGPNIWITWMGAMVAYSPKPPTTARGMLIMFW